MTLTLLFILMLRISLRRDCVAKEAIYIVLGIRPNRNKEVLGCVKQRN